MRTLAARRSHNRAVRSSTSLRAWHVSALPAMAAASRSPSITEPASGLSHAARANVSTARRSLRKQCACARMSCLGSLAPDTLAPRLRLVDMRSIVPQLNQTSQGIFAAKLACCTAVLTSCVSQRENGENGSRPDPALLREGCFGARVSTSGARLVDRRSLGRSRVDEHRAPDLSNVASLHSYARDQARRTSCLARKTLSVKPLAGAASVVCPCTAVMGLGRSTCNRADETTDGAAHDDRRGNPSSSMPRGAHPGRQLNRIARCSGGAGQNLPAFAQGGEERVPGLAGGDDGVPTEHVVQTSLPMWWAMAIRSSMVPPRMRRRQ